MATDDFDDVVEDTHKVNVEHADLLTKRQQKKHTALMKDFHKIQQNIENTPMTALHPLHTEGGSSSSNQTPKPKVKRKAEPIEMMDETGLESIPEEVKKGMKHKMDKLYSRQDPKLKQKLMIQMQITMQEHKHKQRLKKQKRQKQEIRKNEQKKRKHTKQHPKQK